MNGLIQAQYAFPGFEGWRIKTVFINLGLNRKASSCYKCKAGKSAVLCILFCLGCERIDMDKPGNLVPETIDLDPKLPSIPVNNTRLHAESFGDIHNPVIIFIPGDFGSITIRNFLR